MCEGLREGMMEEGLWEYKCVKACGRAQGERPTEEQVCVLLKGVRERTHV